MARASTTTARLVGPPGDVRGVVDVPPAARRSIVAASGSRSGKDGSWPGGRVLTAPAGPELTEVRLLLPESTPPGAVDAELLWDGGAIAVTVEVLAESSVDVRPRALAVSAPAGSEAPVAVHLAARGNVTLDVAQVAVLAFEQSETLERAIVAGLTSKRSGLDRWAAAADALAGSQSGVARVVVGEGAGPLAPGESRWVHAQVHVPAGLEAGSSHAATWLLAGQRVRVELDVTAPPAAPPRSRATAARTPSAPGPAQEGPSTARTPARRQPARKPSSRKEPS